ncbi:hypothetical protein EZS27_023693, partial [termite gut metagenome]
MQKVVAKHVDCGKTDNRRLLYQW